MAARSDGPAAATRGTMDDGDANLELVVLVRGGMSTHALPRAGRVTLGRGEGCDVRVDDASVSRTHAALHAGPALALEDLGSANGTYVRARRDAVETDRVFDARLRPHAPVPLAPGDSFNLGGVVVVVRRAADGAGARDEGDASSGAEPDAPGVVVADPAMRALHALIERVAPGPISVLLLGETGVGKEVLAETIHRRSGRAGPLLRLHCAALSETLLESELFGHEKGAFTGAVATKLGLLETAEGGTVFLDEVGELPASIQVKLLRVLEERAVLRVGALRPRPIDVRVVAATNRDLDAEVARGAFRRDLYFRLNGIALTVPPLRERRSELRLLAETFAARAAGQLGRARAPAFTRDAVAALEAHPWPGNIRELRNVVERAVLLAPADAVAAEHLLLAPPRVEAPSVAPSAGAVGAANAANATGEPALRGELDARERQCIVEALERCGGNQTQAAALLGISRRTLVSRLTEYAIPRPRKRVP